MTSAIHMPAIMTSIWVCGTQSAVASRRRTNIMYEFEMYNVNTKEIETAYGYSLADARERSPKYNSREWVCLMSTYID
jgi:hypothetical protein